MARKSGRQQNTLTQPVVASFSPDQVLSYLAGSGTIDLGRVRTEMIKEEIDKVIESSHTSPIKQGPDGRWRTSVYEGKKRRLIARTSLDDLKLEVYCFYTGMPKEEVFKEHTLETLYPRWIEYKSLHTNSKSSITRIKSVWKNHYLNDEIIHIPVADFDKLTLDTWAHTLIQDGDLTRKQYYNLTIVIRQILDYAVELKLIPFNPFSLVKIDRNRMFRKIPKKKSETQVFTREEQSYMEQMAWEDFEKRKHPVNQLVPLAMIFQFQTGMRIGELCALKHEDICEDKVIVRRMYRSGSKDVIDDTKGTFGEREVVLTDKALDIIWAVVQRKREEGVVNDYLFSLNEKPASYNALRKLYPSYCKRLSIITKSSHKVRKTYISSLIDGNVNINTIRELVGHNDERVTLNNYCYDRNTDKERKKIIQAALAI